MRFQLSSFRIFSAVIVIFAVGTAACAPVITTETLTVYQDAPTMHPLDLGPAGNSPGDAYYFHAPLRSTLGGAVTGEVYGSKTLVKPATATDPNTEQRATLLVFTFGNRQDQIVVAGVPDYPSNASEFDPGEPVLRAVLGGTGRYFSVRGQVTSTRNADGSYVQIFSLIR